MISLTRLALFSAAAVILIFTPGPDIIYVTTRGMAQGRKAALASAGIQPGESGAQFFRRAGPFSAADDIGNRFSDG